MHPFLDDRRKPRDVALEQLPEAVCEPESLVAVTRLVDDEQARTLTLVTDQCGQWRVRLTREREWHAVGAGDT